MAKNISNDPTHLVDLNEANLAVKENRFQDAIKLLDIILSNYPNHIDCLYLAAVSSRYLKNYEESKKYLELLLRNSPDMGRAYQELGHLNRDMGKADIAMKHYRQACELNPALLVSWKNLYNYFIKIKNKPAADTAIARIKKLESLPSSLLYIDQILNDIYKWLLQSKKIRDYFL